MIPTLERSIGSRAPALAATLLLALTAPALKAAPLVWIGDTAGNLITVDIGTGAQTLIGPMGRVFDDIAFDPTGNLWGLRGGDELWRINTTTGASFGQTEVRSQFGFTLGGNSLTFGSDGTLYISGVCILDPVTFAVGLGCISASNPATGQGTILGDTGRSPSGDLAFFGGFLYVTSANFTTANGADDLIRIDLANVAAATVVGNTGVGAMFGLDTGPDGTMYGVANTSIYTVNPGTAATNFIRGWTVGGPNPANGASFQVSQIPLPGTALMLATGLVFAGLRSLVRCARQLPARL
jgi:hypothetical protein